jgi:hypothetical protein
VRFGPTRIQGGGPVSYVPIPLAMIAVGKPLPVTVWSPSGQLLLARGQPVVSEQHKERLLAHDASTTASDAHAWQRAYERMVHTMMRNGVALEVIANASMPSEILQRDYQEVQHLNGNWLDLQDMLRGVLYRGGLAINVLQRFDALEKKTLELLHEDPDDSLFCLFQCLGDTNLGYCASHALLCAVICELTSIKLGFEPLLRQSLLNAALTMNIAMARDQDSLARQSTAPTDWQRTLILEHPHKGADILRDLGVDDPDQLDLVRWHHDPGAAQALPANLMARRLLAMADSFVAQAAARKTRNAQAPVKAVKTMVMGAHGDALGMGSAIAQATGFYPPGTYVLLANGETAVAVQRGERANMPWVIPLLDKNSIPIARYVCKSTSDAAHTIKAPVNFDTVRVMVSPEKVRKARLQIAPLRGT